MVRGYEPGTEDHEFNPRLGDFFLGIFNSVQHCRSVNSPVFIAAWYMNDDDHVI